MSLWRIGLTGGIGSGKSTVGSVLLGLGWGLVDADAESRALTAPGGTAMPVLVQTLGPWAAAPDGGLDRAAVRERVFVDPTLRQRLEDTLHPLVGLAIHARIDALAAQGHTHLVLDIPLLTESPRWRPLLHRVWVVDCPEHLQVQRVVARSGLAPEQVQAIIAAQASRAHRLACADLVIHNAGLGLDALARQVRQAAATVPDPL